MVTAGGPVCGSISTPSSVTARDDDRDAIGRRLPEDLEVTTLMARPAQVLSVLSGGGEDPAPRMGPDGPDESASRGVATAVDPFEDGRTNLGSMPHEAAAEAPRRRANVER